MQEELKNIITQMGPTKTLYIVGITGVFAFIGLTIGTFTSPIVDRLENKLLEKENEEDE